MDSAHYLFDVSLTDLLPAPWGNLFSAAVFRVDSHLSGEWGTKRLCLDIGASPKLLRPNSGFLTPKNPELRRNQSPSEVSIISIDIAAGTEVPKPGIYRA